MNQNRCRIRELLDTDVPADELERLARVDELLRAAVRIGGPTARGRATHLRLVPPRATAEDEVYELKLSFGQLTLISKSLQAARTLGAVPPQDELLDDTIQLVDQALRRAI